MIENAIRLYILKRIAIDPIFPPPEDSKWMPGKRDYIPDDILK
jgi:hypothetical protein